MKCALIGHGMVAGTHVAACQASDQVTLVGVLGRDVARAKDFAAAQGLDTAYADLSALVDDDTLDFVIVTTPPDARAAIVSGLASARVPILLEKPVERTLGAAHKVVATCQAANVPLGVVFQHRARAASQALKDAISSGALGEIVQVEIRVPWWREQSYYDAPGRGTYARDGGGVMLTQAIHTLDLALWLAGPVAQVQALMRTTPVHQLEAEDWAGALLQFESGAVGSLMATTAAFPGQAESIFIQGTKAAATLAEGVLTSRSLDGREDRAGETSATGGGADPMAFTHAWHQTVIEDFAQAVSSGHSPLAPGTEALMSHAVIDAMERASRSGQVEEVLKL